MEEGAILLKVVFNSFKRVFKISSIISSIFLKNDCW